MALKQVNLGFGKRGGNKKYFCTPLSALLLAPLFQFVGENWQNWREMRKLSLSLPPEHWNERSIFKLIFRTRNWVLAKIPQIELWRRRRSSSPLSILSPFFIISALGDRPAEYIFYACIRKWRVQPSITTHFLAYSSIETSSGDRESFEIARATAETRALKSQEDFGRNIHSLHGSRHGRKREGWWGQIEIGSGEKEERGKIDCI